MPKKRSFEGKVRALHLELPEALLRQFDAVNALEGINRTIRLIYLIERDTQVRMRRWQQMTGNNAGPSASS